MSFGTLCVIDTEPRPDGLKPDQAFALRALAQQVMAQLELRRAVREREAALAAERQARDALAISEERYRLSSRATHGPDLGLEPADRPDPLGRGPVRALRYGRGGDRAEHRLVVRHHIHPEDGDRVRRSVRAAIADASLRWSERYRFRRADGTYATVLTAPSSSAHRRHRHPDDRRDARRDPDRPRPTRIGRCSAGISHRLKNTLAMVQAIASQTLRDAPDVASARDALLQRLLALGKAHDILLAGNAERARMEAVIRGALALHDNARPGRLRIEGAGSRYRAEGGPRPGADDPRAGDTTRPSSAPSRPRRGMSGRPGRSRPCRRPAAPAELGGIRRSLGGPALAQGVRHPPDRACLRGHRGGAVRPGLPGDRAALHLTAPLAGFQGKDGILN